MQGFFSGVSRLRLKEVRIENLEEVEKPLILNIQYEAPDAFHPVASRTTGTTLVGRLPSPWETFYLEVEYLQRRKSPFELTTPIRLESTVDFTLPEGFELDGVARLVDSKKTRFVARASRAKVEGVTMKREFRARRHTGFYRADDYATYYRDMKNALRIFNRPLRIEASGSDSGKLAAR